MTIQAKIREPQAKTKTLRRAGYVPGSIYGAPGEASQLIAVPSAEAERLLRRAGTGAKLELVLDGRPCSVLLRDAPRDPVTRALQHLGFQAVAEDTRVASTVRIQLTEREKQTASVTQTLFEVPYTALAGDMPGTISINVASLPVGTRLTVGDLPELAGDKIELGIPRDTLVVKILDNRRQPQRES